MLMRGYEYAMNTEQAERVKNLEVSLTQVADENSAARLELLGELSWELRRTDTKRALGLSKEAHALARELRHTHGLAYSLLTKGYCQMRLSELEDALANVAEARTFFEQLGDKEGLRRALNTLGIIYGDSGDFLGALKVFLEAQKLCAELHDARGEAGTLNNIGIIYAFIGDYASALDYHLRSLRLFRELNNRRGEVEALHNVGMIYYERKRYSEALEYFLQSLTISEIAEEVYTQAFSLFNIGRAYLKLNDYKQAYTYGEKSLSLMNAMGDRLGISNVLTHLGLLHLKTDRFREAEVALEQSLAIKKEVGDLKGQAETQVFLSQLLCREERYDESISILSEALANAQQVGSQADIYKTHEALAEVYWRKEAFREAFNHLQRYIEAKDKVFNESSDLRLQGLRVQFEIEQAEKETEIYRLRNVELAQANEGLRVLTESLQRANHQKSQLLKQLEQQAREDALTGLYNRRYFDAQLAQEFARTRRSGYSLSVMICDLDDFKKINDRFSHRTGDEVLRVMARLLRDNIREMDTVARYGGEEFVGYFPETSASEAKIICERIWQAVIDYPWQSVHPDLRVTASIGLSDDIRVLDYEKMLSLADDKMYEAKRSGKNQVKY